MVYLTTDDVGGSLRNLLDVYLNWNGIIGYTSDIMDYWEDIFDKDEDGIKEFLDEEGIYGYTTDILDLLNSGEVTISDMDEEDFMKLKRQLGIYESVKSTKSRGRSLQEDDYEYKEDTEKCKKVERFLSRIDIHELGLPLVRERDGIVEVEFPDVTLTGDDIRKIQKNAKEILGVNVTTDTDGDYFTFYFKLDESSNKKLKEGKLVEPLDEDIKFFEDYIKSTLKYDIEAKGRTWFDNIHYQLRSRTANKTMPELKEFAHRLNILDELMDKREVPMTYNAGLTEDGFITAGVDLYKKWIPDEQETVVESKQINEGPGAGYTISGKIGDVHINDFAVDVKEETETAIFYRVTGDIVLDLVDISCESYYYGGTIPEATAKVDYIDLSAEKSWELPTPTEDDVYNLLMSNVDFETVYGGGWSHSTFGNDLELDYNDIKNYYGDYDLDKIAFKFTDPKVVDAIDKYASGENYDIEFSVLDEDEYEVEFFDNKEDAIEYAKENNLPYVCETHWGWEYLGDGEYNTTDRVDSSEVIWTNEDFGE